MFIVEFETSPLPCLVPDEVTHIACGADFTVWLSSTEGASILYAILTLWSSSGISPVMASPISECLFVYRTAGLPQYGQLGHGTDNEVIC